MKKSIILFSIAISLLCTGCRSILMKWYGVKKPDYETTQSIEKFKNEVFGVESQYLTVNFNSWLENEIFSLPDVYVFSKDGIYIPYKDSLRPNCNGPAEVFLSELNPGKNYHYGAEFSLHEFLLKLDKPGCYGTPVIGNDLVDFYVFITWANWTGKKLYREKTVEWFNALQKNTKMKYKLFMVNQDLQECWSEEQKKQLESQSGNNH